MAKRQSKSGASKKRAKSYVSVEKRQRAVEPTEDERGGAMQGMVSGFKRAVGVETKKKKTWVDYAWTVFLVVALVAVLLWRFGS